MPDHFATLSLPRAPWLDTDDLKDRFFRLSSTRHPDAGGSAEAFSELNAAWQVLRDPAARLRHYLELEHPSALQASTTTPPELGDLFMDVANACQNTQKLATQFANATSPLSRSLLEKPRRVQKIVLDSLAERLDLRQQAALDPLRQGLTDSVPLATTLTLLVFLGKWLAQVRESRLALA